MAAQIKSQFYNSNGEPVLLSDEIARGGEGRILNVSDTPDLVAKIYHHSIDKEKATKLSVMVGLKTDRLLSLSAWPVDTLHDFVGGPVTGRGRDIKYKNYASERIASRREAFKTYRSANAIFPQSWASIR